MLNKDINAIRTDTKMKAQLADLIHLRRFHQSSNWPPSTVKLAA
jgi:hypothetical protein